MRYIPIVAGLAISILSGCGGGGSTDSSVETGTENNSSPPTIPQNVSITGITSSQLTLGWSASSDADNDLNGYRIYRDGVQIMEVATNTLSYNDTGLSASTAYSYTVLAFDAAGNTSTQSAMMTATTMATAPPPTTSNLLYLDFNQAPDGNGVYSGSVGSAGIWTTQGATHEYLPTEGWNNSGGARFTPPDGSGASIQGYAGLAPSLSENNMASVNLRFLVKWSAGFGVNCPTGGAKWTMLNRVSGAASDRTWIGVYHPPAEIGGGLQLPLNHHNTIFGIHGDSASCTGGFCTWGHSCAHCDPNWGRISGVGPFKVADYEEQWVAIEFEARNTGDMKIYIWTQDGVYNGDYIWTNQGPALNMSGFSIIGGFWDWGCADAGSFIFDEMVISTEYIGPPAGFLP